VAWTNLQFSTFRGTYVDPKRRHGSGGKAGAFTPTISTETLLRLLESFTILNEQELIPGDGEF
jgi:hypothetical protein